MTENHLAGLWTLIAMIAFLSVCIWAYSAKRRSDFDEAANLPFADEDDIDRDDIERDGIEKDDIAKNERNGNE